MQLFLPKYFHPAIHVNSDTHFPGVKLPGKLVQCFHLPSNLLLAVKQDCTVDIVHLMQAEVTLNAKLNGVKDELCVVAAYNSPLLAIATCQREIYVRIAVLFEIFNIIIFI